jgi:hypothetical protein
MRISVFVIGALFLLAISMSGCRYCMCCASRHWDAYCTKVGPWTEISGTSAASLMDQINYYQNQGYTCSIDSGIGSYTNYTCGRSTVNSTEQSGNPCKVPDDADSCD